MIYVEGIRFKVDWNAFVVGTTFWVPCLNTDDVIRQLKEICAKRDIKVRMIESVERGVLGVRIWRMPDRPRARSAIDIINSMG